MVLTVLDIPDVRVDREGNLSTDGGLVFDALQIAKRSSYMQGGPDSDL